jgi:CBS domain-containing protein
MLIRELMARPPVVVREDTPLGEVAQAMLARQVGCAAVVDNSGELCGVIIEEDFVPEERLLPFSTERLPKVFDQWVPRRGVAQLYKGASSLKAKDIMRTAAVAVAEDAPVEEALLMVRSHRCVPVVRGNVPIGMFSPHEVLHLMT